MEVYDKPVPVRGGFVMQLVDSQCPISRTLFNGESWEAEVEEAIAANHGSLFLDLGAYIGTFTLPATRNFKEVIAVEPHPDSFRLLKRNVALNGLNVELYHAAASDHDGWTTLRLAEGNPGSTFTDTERGNKRVKALHPRTILKGRRPDFVKVDIEGDEYKVLTACPELLEAQVIVTEYSPTQLKRQGGPDGDVFLDLLRGAGFRFAPPPARSYQNIVATRH